VKHITSKAVDETANQTVRLDLGTKDGVKSMRIGFTDQRLTAHGGLAVWTRFITERGLREELRAVLPHAPTSPNAYDPTDTALGFIGGTIEPGFQLALQRETVRTQGADHPVKRPPRRRTDTNYPQVLDFRLERQSLPDRATSRG
jgi:hypothetical protein